MMLKVVIFGEGGVGKSALTIQLTQNYFVLDYDPTIENSYRKQLTIGSEVQMIDILDTAGQEEYSAMKEQYIRTGQGFIIVYSVGSRSSFETVGEQYKKILDVKEAEFYPCILAANKSDIPAGEREVSTEEGGRLAAELGVKYIETSAKTRKNVEELFETIVLDIKRFQKHGGDNKRSIQDPESRKGMRNSGKLFAQKHGCTLI